MTRLFLVSSVLLASALPGWSQYFFTGDGSWLDPARWDTGVVPPDGSTAVINGNAEISENIVAAQNQNPARVEIGSGLDEIGVLRVSGGTLSGAHGGGLDGGVYVGLEGGTGTLVIEEGATYRSQGGNMRVVIGDEFGGTGTISVAGVLQNYKILEIVNGTLEMLPTGQNNLFNEAVPSFIGANGTLAFVIDGSNVGALKRSNTNGLQLTIDPSATLEITLESSPQLNDSWVLMDYTTLSGQFAQGTSFTNQQGYTFEVDYGSGSNDVVTLTFVSDSLRPKLEDVQATPAALSAGQSSTLSWTASNFDTLTLDPVGANVTGGSSFEVSPTETTTYTLTATLGAVMVSRDVTVVVDELPEINSFGASAVIVAPGGATTLAWDVSGAASIEIQPAPGAVGAVGSVEISPAATTTYTLTATNASGSVTAEVEVVVDALQASVIHEWDAAGEGQGSGALLDPIGGKNFDITGGDLMTGLTSEGTSFTAALSRVNLDANTGGDNGLGFPATDTTYEFWIKLEELDDRSQVIFETGSPNDGSCLLVSSLGVRFLHAVGGTVIIDLEAPVDLVNTEDFIQVVASVDGTNETVDLYVRGALGGNGSDRGSGSIGVPIGRASILTWSGFAGAIADSLGGMGAIAPTGLTTLKGSFALGRIYDRPLSASEVDESFLRIANEIIDGDTDGDGLPDWWELRYFPDLSSGPGDDPDGDSLSNDEERLSETNPVEADTDGDGLDDNEELLLPFPTDPNNPDTDGDLLTDGEEVNGAVPTDPTLEDTDFDGLWDVLEITLGSDPNDILSLPSDAVGEPWASLHVPGTYSSFDSSLLASDFEDATFRLWVDFEEKLDGEREVLFESGGATVGISLCYEAGNQVVLRAVGSGGFELAEAAHTLTPAELAAGFLEVIATYDVDDGLGNFDSAIALLIEGRKVAGDTGPLGGDWTGTNSAAFGVASDNLAGVGDNTPLTGVDFVSGMIDYRRGLIYYPATLFEGVSIGVIEITDISYDAGNGEVTITFRSEPGKSYAVSKGIDLQAFTPVATSITSGGDTTTTPPIASSEAAAFFIVSEE